MEKEFDFTTTVNPIDTLVNIPDATKRQEMQSELEKARDMLQGYVKENGHLNLDTEMATLANTLGVLSPAQKEEYKYYQNHPMLSHMRDIPMSIASGVVDTVDNIIETSYDLFKYSPPALLVDYALDRRPKEDLDLIESNYKSPYASGKVLSTLSNFVSSTLAFIPLTGTSAAGIIGAEALGTLTGVDSDSHISSSYIEDLAKQIDNEEFNEAVNDLVSKDFTVEASKKVLGVFENIIIGEVFKLGGKSAKALGLDKEAMLVLTKAKRVVKNVMDLSKAVAVNPALKEALKKSTSTKTTPKKLTAVKQGTDQVLTETKSFQVEALVKEEAAPVIDITKPTQETLQTQPQYTKEAGVPYMADTQVGEVVSATNINDIAKQVFKDIRDASPSFKENKKAWDEIITATIDEDVIANIIKETKDSANIIQTITDNVRPKIDIILERAGENLRNASKETYDEAFDKAIDAYKAHAELSSSLGSALRSLRDVGANVTDVEISRFTPKNIPTGDIVVELKSIMKHPENKKLFDSLIKDNNNNIKAAMKDLVTLHSLANTTTASKFSETLNRAIVAGILSSASVMEKAVLGIPSSLITQVGQDITANLRRLYKRNPETAALAFAGRQRLKTLAIIPKDFYKISKIWKEAMGKENGVQRLDELLTKEYPLDVDLNRVAAILDHETLNEASMSLLRESLPDGKLYNLIDEAKRLKEGSLVTNGLSAWLSITDPTIRATFGTLSAIDRFATPMINKLTREYEVSLRAFQLSEELSITPMEALSKLKDIDVSNDLLQSVARGELDQYISKIPTGITNELKLIKGRLEAEGATRATASRAFNMIDLHEQHKVLSYMHDGFSKLGFLKSLTPFVRASLRGTGIALEEAGISNVSRGGYSLSEELVKQETRTKQIGAITLMGAGFFANLSGDVKSEMDAANGKASYKEINKFHGIPLTSMGAAAWIFTIGNLLGSTYKLGLENINRMDSFKNLEKAIISFTGHLLTHENILGDLEYSLSNLAKRPDKFLGEMAIRGVVPASGLAMSINDNLIEAHQKFNDSLSQFEAEVQRSVVFAPIVGDEGIQEVDHFGNIVDFNKEDRLGDILRTTYGIQPVDISKKFKSDFINVPEKTINRIYSHMSNIADTQVYNKITKTYLSPKEEMISIITSNMVAIDKKERLTAIYKELVNKAVKTEALFNKEHSEALTRATLMDSNWDLHINQNSSKAQLLPDNIKKLILQRIQR